ncbi:MAG: hypothetical protein RSP_04990 [Rhodanobacter sp.]
MTTASRTDDETVLMLCAHSQHMTTMRGYAQQRYRRNSLLGQERGMRRRQEDEEDARNRAKAQAIAAQQDTQAMVAQHRNWNAMRAGSRGGWRHFG